MKVLVIVMLYNKIYQWNHSNDDFVINNYFQTYTLRDE